MRLGLGQTASLAGLTMLGFRLLFATETLAPERELTILSVTLSNREENHGLPSLHHEQRMAEQPCPAGRAAGRGLSLQGLLPARFRGRAAGPPSHVRTSRLRAVQRPALRMRRMPR